MEAKVKNFKALILRTLCKKRELIKEFSFIM
jgi:hypothetical protein